MVKKFKKLLVKKLKTGDIKNLLMFYLITK